MPVVGLLDGDLQKAIYDGFRGRLFKGVLRRYESPTSGGLDPKGDPIDTSDYNEFAIEGFRDEYSRFTMAQSGIPETDYKVCIFGGSSPDLTPRGGDIVRLDPKTGSFWSRLRGGKGGVKVDPAGALWECQAFAADAP